MAGNGERILDGEILNDRRFREVVDELQGVLEPGLPVHFASVRNDMVHGRYKEQTSFISDGTITDDGKFGVREKNDMAFVVEQDQMRRLGPADVDETDTYRTGGILASYYYSDFPGNLRHVKPSRSGYIDSGYTDEIVLGDTAVAKARGAHGAIEFAEDAIHFELPEDKVIRSLSPYVRLAGDGSGPDSFDIRKKILTDIQKRQMVEFVASLLQDTGIVTQTGRDARIEATELAWYKKLNTPTAIEGYDMRPTDVLFERGVSGKYALLGILRPGTDDRFDLGASGPNRTAMFLAAPEFSGIIRAALGSVVEPVK